MTSITVDMALLQISEPGQAPDPHQRRIAVGIDLGTTHSLVAAVRHGVAECLPDAQGRVLLPSVVRYLEGQRRQIGFEARAHQAEDAANTIASAKRLMGRRLADLQGRRAAALRLRRPARHGGGAHAPGPEDRGRGVGRDPGHAAPACRGQFRRRAVRRRHHRAGLLRRCAAPGHQGRRAAGRPEGAAPDQRAHRRGRGLRPGPWQRRPVCGLRPGRRHLRRVAAAPDPGRVRGRGHRRRRGLGRRRLRPPAGRLGAAAVGPSGRQRAGQGRAADGRAAHARGAHRPCPWPRCIARWMAATCAST